MIRRRGFLQSLFAVFLPTIQAGEAAPPTEPIAIPTPAEIGLNATNPQMFRDRAGVIFAASRADTSIGGVVWRVDNYIDREHPGVYTFVLNDPNNPQPTKFFANGELIIWPDGYLRYVTVEIPSLADRTAYAQVAYPIPGWTP